ncbi:6,7-dimethyl-8-ribityllumazine synthase [bacterium]|nr:6,7-dimethyl-8-ribityllumazine synthase [bacterium]
MKTNKFVTIRIEKRNTKIAIIRARFNNEITGSLSDGAVKALEKSGIIRKNIDIYNVPGSFEIPIKCLRLAKSKKYDGIITLGSVIKGETPHFDFVAKAVTEGVLKVMIEENIVITFGVITTNNLKQAKDRSGDNKRNKGYEAAMAMVEMLNG